MSQSVADILLVAKTRNLRLTEMIEELRMYGQRAQEPADKVAFAEIEQELLRLHDHWFCKGLVVSELTLRGGRGRSAYTAANLPPPPRCAA